MSCAQVPYLSLPCELWWRARDEHAGWRHTSSALSAGASAKAGETGEERSDIYMAWTGQTVIELTRPVLLKFIVFFFAASCSLHGQRQRLALLAKSIVEYAGQKSRAFTAAKRAICQPTYDRPLSGGTNSPSACEQVVPAAGESTACKTVQVRA